MTCLCLKCLLLSFFFLFICFGKKKKRNAASGATACQCFPAVDLMLWRRQLPRSPQWITEHFLICSKFSDTGHVGVSKVASAWTLNHCWTWSTLPTTESSLKTNMVRNFYFWFFVKVWLWHTSAPLLHLSPLDCAGCVILATSFWPWMHLWITPQYEENHIYQIVLLIPCLFFE